MIIRSLLLTNPTRLYAYDAFGNMTQNGPHAVAVDASTNRLAAAITPAGGSTLPYAAYDAAGNLLQFGQHQFNYDPAGRLGGYTHHAPSGAVDAKGGYWYDVDGERIARCRKAGGGEEFTFYLRDEGGHVLTEFRADYCPEPQTGFSGFALAATYLQEDFSYFGGKLTASSRINNFASDACPQWAFYHADHLGNPRLITDESRRITATHTYWPFGEEITAQGQDDLTHKYTGHERDFESNLDYMHARYYNNFLGRFLSPDPKRILTSEYSPLKWNKYTYALNNPIYFVDPNGGDVIDSPYYSGEQRQNIANAETLIKSNQKARLSYMNTPINLSFSPYERGAAGQAADTKVGTNQVTAYGQSQASNEMFAMSLFHESVHVRGGNEGQAWAASFAFMNATGMQNLLNQSVNFIASARAGDFGNAGAIYARTIINQLPVEAQQAFDDLLSAKNQQQADEATQKIKEVLSAEGKDVIDKINKEISEKILSSGKE